jgi:hypothetical protein
MSLLWQAAHAPLKLIFVGLANDIKGHVLNGVLPTHVCPAGHKHEGCLLDHHGTSVSLATTPKVLAI